MKTVAYLSFILAVGITIAVRFTYPQLTETELFLDHIGYWIAVVVLFVVGIYLLLRSEKK